MSANTSTVAAQTRTYICPMHPAVRRPDQGKCPKCGMDLVLEGTRFGFFKHVIKSPVMLAIMAAAMIAMIVLMLNYAHG